MENLGWGHDTILARALGCEKTVVARLGEVFPAGRTIS